MLQKLLNRLKNEALIFFISLVLLILTVNTLSTFYYRSIIQENAKIREQVLEANQRLETMNRNVNLMDLGFRGYVIHQSEQLLHPFHLGNEDYLPNFERLGELLDSLDYDTTKMQPAVKAIGPYATLVEKMITMVDEGRHEEVKEIFIGDPGYDAWKVYSVFDTDAKAFVSEIELKSKEEYDLVIIRMMVTQSILFVLGFPLLIIVIFIIRRNSKSKKELFEQLETNNKKYIFDPGVEGQYKSEEGTIALLISNLKKVSKFIKGIATGNYTVQWEGITEENMALNTDSIAGELGTMRDEMQKIKQADEVRIWTTEGLSKFSETVRNNQNDLQTLSTQVLSQIVKYLGVQQGGMFIVEENETGDGVLNMTACYAFGKDKMEEKTIFAGQGLVGQCFNDGETMHLTDVPKGYVNINSGLGETNHGTLLLVPLRVNEITEGVLELASLEKFKDHEIEFLQKLGEIIASAIANTKITEKTSNLLVQSQQQTEEMHAQEEEMRQNMEELQATQEQMGRKNLEFEDLLNKSSEKEKKLLKEIKELKKGK